MAGTEGVVGTGTAAAGTSGQGAGAAGAAGAGGQAGAQQTSQSTESTFEEWLAKQPKESQDRYAAREKDWKATQSHEREDRDALKAQLVTLKGKAEKGSELERQLTDSLAKIEETDRRADFYEAAHAAGVTNLKLAFMVAVDEELIDKRKGPDFVALKQKYPELFLAKLPVPKGNAGEGTGGGGPAPAAGMNAIIRRAAGRR